jgi:hypothetical protein
MDLAQSAATYYNSPWIYLGGWMGGCRLATMLEIENLGSFELWKHAWIHGEVRGGYLAVDASQPLSVGLVQ